MVVRVGGYDGQVDSRSARRLWGVISRYQDSRSDFPLNVIDCGSPLMEVCELLAYISGVIIRSKGVPLFDVAEVT
jgi:hypothetical protein